MPNDVYRLYFTEYITGRQMESRDDENGPKRRNTRHLGFK